MDGLENAPEAFIRNDDGGEFRQTASEGWGVAGSRRQGKAEDMTTNDES